MKARASSLRCRPVDPTRLIVLSILPIFSAFGCSNGGLNGEGGGPGPIEQLFTFGTDIESPSLTTGFVGTFTALNGQSLSIDNALEVPGGGTRIDVIPGQNAVVVRDRERRGLQRLEIGADGSIEPGQFVSFAGVGVANVNGSNVIVQDDLAIYFANVDRLVVRWNPTTMEILDTQELDIENPDSNLYEFPVIRPPTIEVVDGTIIMPVTWQSGPLPPNYYGGTPVIVYDIESGELNVNNSETRCGAVNGPTIGNDGYWYYGTSPLATLTWLYFDDQPRPCIIRKRPGETAFDSEYIAYYDEIDENRIFGGLFGIGPNTAAVQEIDLELAEELDTEENIQTIRDVRDFETFVRDVMRWRRLDLTTNVLTDLGLQPGRTRFDLQYVDEVAYLVNFQRDFEELGRTRVIDMSNVQVAFEATGLVRSFARVF